MKEFTIGANDAGQRLNKFLEKSVPGLPGTLMYKYLRLKRIKLNGKRAEASDKLAFGDVVSLYINDEFFAPTPRDDAALRLKPVLSIVYEDDNILLVDKKPGMIVHSDDKEQHHTLINHIKAYLYQHGEWDPEKENSFVPALANRIDRNTGGIVMAAKNAESLRVLNEKIKSREIRKFYLCLVNGVPEPSEGRLFGFIFKDKVKNRVYVKRDRVPGSKSATTRYRTIAVKDGVSLVECELLTGRTHQIRAQFAAADLPLVGDGKYGKLSESAGDASYQMLYSYKLRFSFTGAPCSLTYLNGKTFEVESVPFALPFLQR